MGSNSPGQSICLRHELVSDISMESRSLYTPVQHRSFWVLVPGDRNHGSFHLQYGLLLTAGRTLLALSRSILETLGGGGVTADLVLCCNNHPKLPHRLTLLR